MNTLGQIGCLLIHSNDFLFNQGFSICAQAYIMQKYMLHFGLHISCISIISCPLVSSLLFSLLSANMISHLDLLSCHFMSCIGLPQTLHATMKSLILSFHYTHVSNFLSCLHYPVLSSSAFSCSLLLSPVPQVFHCPVLSYSYTTFLFLSSLSLKIPLLACPLLFCPLLSHTFMSCHDSP